MFFIDAKNRTITEVQDSPNLATYYRLIGCSLIDAVQLPTGDFVYVDDEGLLKNPAHFFAIDGHILAGNGVVVGMGAEGDDSEPVVDLSSLKRSIRFLNSIQVGAMIGR